MGIRKGFRLRAKLLQSTEQDPRLGWWDSGSFKGYAISYCHRNQWRVPSYLQLEDLVSEAYAAFLDSCRRYPWAIEKKHLMHLYKMYLSCVITDLTYRGSFDKLCISELQVDKEDAPVDAISLVAGDGLEVLELKASLCNLPTELLDVLRALLSDSIELLQTKTYKEGRKYKKVRETTNERLCRLVGKDPAKVNLAGGLYDFLKYQVAH